MVRRSEIEIESDKRWQGQRQSPYNRGFQQCAAKATVNQIKATIRPRPFHSDRGDRASDNSSKGRKSS